MPDRNLMQTYEILQHTSRQMLAAARDAEWKRLVALEQDCRRLVDTLPADGEWQQLDEEHLRRRREIIRQVLADDAEIRDLAEPWMAQAKQFLTSLALERKLMQSYRQDRAP